MIKIFRGASGARASSGVRGNTGARAGVGSSGGGGYRTNPGNSGGGIFGGGGYGHNNKKYHGPSS